MTKLLMLDKQPIMLIGFMGTGKSTIGEVVANMMGFDFVDIDREIEKECDLTIPEIFKMKGEKYFREVESSVLSKVSRQPEIVVACGGGTVISKTNRRILKNNSFVVWLRCPIAQCVKRCNNGNRPLLSQSDPISSAKNLFREREPFYRQVADMEIFTNGNSAEEIAEALALNLKTLDIKEKL